MAAFLRHRVTQADTLRGLAVQYFGKHERWGDIAALNHLDPSQYDLVGVAELLIPIELGQVGFGNDPFLIDLMANAGSVVTDDMGNLVTRGGTDNYIQSIMRALTTNLGEVVTHPDYGMDLDRCVGVAGTALFLRFLRLEAERVINRDPRTDKVLKVAVVHRALTREVQIGAHIKPKGTQDTIELLVNRRV